ncbi:MAG TPA: bifunctional 3-(3-hydroxy-phenyl)propionate/3-hydroxycinnamic acid hydroxylase [Solirubrobacteraceae bacterium]|nr:bifunctional 3-(3-hydroxy-phenyl)propionate/3-hydroxycinnamic acid hydroxylase [Solirubrobacteraceae bacterium]
MTASEPDFDVLIIGGGPVGQFLTILLGRSGKRVCTVERWPDPYPLPRACGLNHESLRNMQAAGLSEHLLPILKSIMGDDINYLFRNAHDETLLEISWNRPGVCGWPEVASFYQPDLEDRLDAAIRELATVELRRGCEAIACGDDGSRAWATVRASAASNGASAHSASAATEETLTARYVIGADGANSLVRRAIGAEQHDLGFEYPWLVVDVLPKTEREFWPDVLQRCDPARPTTSVTSGPGRRRWEFMCLPGESEQEMNTTETAWRLLEPWEVTPEDSILVRHAVYTFKGVWSQEWRSGRLLLAGDAAHLMPPFLGQGLTSGIRDASSLAWRLRLVLEGKADERLLDSYGPERRAHAQQVIEASVEVGKVICMLDPEQAAARDRQMIASLSEHDAAPPVWRLGPGVLLDGDPLAGTLAVQGMVEVDGHVGLADDVIGRGFVLLGAREDPREYLDEGAGALWASIDGVTAGFGEDGPVRDVDLTYRDWFTTLGAEVALVRPDFYLFGSSPRIEDTSALVGKLAEAAHLSA